jgi:hypothetical protein
MDVDMATDGTPSAQPPAPTTPASAGSPGASKLAEPRRRNRPALSCIQCRTRKIRCDRNEPCASCMKSKIVNCTYEEARRPKPRLWRLSPAPAPGSQAEHSPTSADERPSVGSTYAFRDMSGSARIPGASLSPSGHGTGSVPLSKTPDALLAASPRSLSRSQPVEAGAAITGPLGNTAALTERIRQLEQQLADATKRPSNASSSSQPLHAPLPPHHGPYLRPCGSSTLLDGDKLVGRPSQVPRACQRTMPVTV